MKFLVDECTGPAVARWLEQQGYDVFSIYDQARGVDDDKVIKIAQDEGRILITNDRGFGEKVFRKRRPHNGVVFLRLANERSVNDSRTWPIVSSIRRFDRGPFCRSYGDPKSVSHGLEKENLSS